MYLLKKICLVEDESDLNQLLVFYLEKANYGIQSCTNLMEAQKYISDTDISIWIIDIMLPDGNGLDLLKQIKTLNPSISVIIISAKGDRFDRVTGFELGCDDYISKPFLPAELVYRVNKLNVSINTEMKNENLIEFGPYFVDVEKRIVLDHDKKCEITSKEFDIILFFIHHQKIAISREQLLNSVWGLDYFGNDRIVDNYIKNIRKKLPGVSLETLYGYGYRYNK